MKKFNLFIGLFITTLLLSTQAYSQMKFGVKGGMNYAKLTSVDDEDGILKGLLGPQAGLVVYSDLEKAAYFQTGLLYSVKGVKAEEEGISMDLKYDFIELPLNVGYQIPVGSGFKISPFVGAYGGYALKGTMKLMGMSFDIFDNEFIEDGDEKPKRIDYGANAGLGVHFGKHLILTGQYAYGLANLGDSESTVNTRTASLTLNFVF